MTKALDVCAPLKTFTIKSHFKFGLSEHTKELMKKRDDARLNMSKASLNNHDTLQKQYRKLRNLVNNKIRQETINFNNKRVNEANNENEVWNIVKEVTSPKSNSAWELKISKSETTKDHQTISDTLNSFFADKITKLQSNIECSNIEDPTCRSAVVERSRALLNSLDRG